VSILFFLYVFGYLLRSKRRREQKKRLRKLNKLRRTQVSGGSSGHSQSSHHDHEKDVGLNGSYRSSRSASVAVETEAMASTSTLNRFITGIRSQRRRFSRAGPDGVNNLALEIATDGSESASKAGHRPPGSSSKNLQWTPSSVGFNLVDESPSEIVSYAMNSDNVVIPSGEITGRGHGGGGGGNSKIKKLKVSDNEHSHGSFFLRAGAVAFGLGTMIYDGLEFGAFLEVPTDSPCFALLRGLNPVLHAAFVFLQMYFIFISARVTPILDIPPLSSADILIRLLSSS
jgi:Otopetrin